MRGSDGSAPAAEACPLQHGTLCNQREERLLILHQHACSLFETRNHGPRRRQQVVCGDHTLQWFIVSCSGGQCNSNLTHTLRDPPSPSCRHPAGFGSAARQTSGACRLPTPLSRTPPLCGPSRPVDCTIEQSFSRAHCGLISTSSMVAINCVHKDACYGI